jgi:pyruvate dehydrogenase E1 component alpha subunit
MRRDPLTLARQRLLAAGVPADSVTAAAERAAAAVALAVTEAKEAPPPDPADALTDVWADGGSAWRT